MSELLLLCLDFTFVDTLFQGGLAPFLEVPSLDRNESLVTGSTAALDTAAEEVLVETLEPWVLVASPFE